MFITVNSKNEIIDIASEEVNLSSRYRKNNTIYEITNPPSNMRIGDQFVGGAVVSAVPAISYELIIKQEMRNMAINSLKTKGEIPIDYTEGN